MSKILILVAIAALSVQMPHAQESTRPVELSVGGSLQAVVFEGETVHLMSIPMRVGVFLNPQVSLELEGILTGLDEQLAEETTWGYVATGSFAYHIPVSGQVRPFLLAGYGFSDSWPLASVLATGDFEDTTLGVLNAGAGVKAMVGERAALRVEYRMQKFSGSWEVPDYAGGGDVDIDFTIHSTMFGVSLFL
jgi:hypothetical protein